MSDTPPNTGPDHNTLRLLRDFLPSLKKGMKDGTLRGKGRVSKPRKMCKVCGMLWDNVLVTAATEVKVQGDFCGVCDAKLKSGMIALVYSDRYAFVQSKGKLEDFKGSILHVSEHVMQAVEQKFKQIEVKAKVQKDGSDKHSSPGTNPAAN